MVGRERIDVRLSALDGMLALLDELSEVDTATLATSDIHRAALERALEVGVQVVIDVGTHVVVARGRPSPETYADVMRDLAALGVFDADLARRLARAAGLRNLLAHEYARIDIARLLALLPTARADLAAARDALHRALA